MGTCSDIKNNFSVANGRTVLRCFLKIQPSFGPKYKEENDRSAIGCLMLKDLAPYLAVGAITDRLPVKRPDLPGGQFSVQNVIAIGTSSKAEKVYWFLCRSDQELSSWMNEVVKTLPPPPAPPPGQQQPSAPYSTQPPTAPPPHGGYPTAPVQQGYPTAPPQPQGAYPTGVPVAAPYGGAQPGYYPQQPMVAGQPYPSTVIVQQTPAYRRDNGGNEFATGMLVGGMMGYGMGGGWGWGGHGYGHGYGWGHGGGFYQDNDTTVVNNYYGDTNQGDVVEVGEADFGGDDFGGDMDMDMGGGDFDFG